MPGLAGAIAGMILADSGAAVTVIEPPDGSPLRPTQWWPVLSRGKTSQVIRPGPTFLSELSTVLAGADVAIHSFPRESAPLAALRGRPVCHPEWHLGADIVRHHGVRRR